MKEKAQFIIYKSSSCGNEYRHINIEIRADFNEYSHDWAEITFQSNRETNKETGNTEWVPWYGMHVSTRVERNEDVKHFGAVCKALTADEYGGFFQTPAACIEALQQAGFVQVIRQSVSFPERCETHAFEPGEYFGAYLPSWGDAYTNDKGRGKMIAAITDAVMSKSYGYGEKAIAAWATAGFPMQRVSVTEPNMTALLDPNEK